jgi:hypothetical protein
MNGRAKESSPIDIKNGTSSIINFQIRSNAQFTRKRCAYENDYRPFSYNRSIHISPLDVRSIELICIRDSCPFGDTRRIRTSPWNNRDVPWGIESPQTSVIFHTAKRRIANQFFIQPKVNRSQAVDTKRREREICQMQWREIDLSLRSGNTRKFCESCHNARGKHRRDDSKGVSFLLIRCYRIFPLAGSTRIVLRYCFI